MINTYLQYGISLELATKLDSLNLSKTTFEQTPKKNLIDKYGLSKDEVDLVRDLIKRKPIDENTIQELLENSSYTCCICKGQKGDSYVIHHIVHYSVSQDNSYHNLAVLCPSDHDLAHKEGKTLTLRLTPEQILSSKGNWEKQVAEQRVHRASISGDINEIEFLNIPRVLEAANEIFKEIPKTKYTESLVSEDLVKHDGHINQEKVAKLGAKPNAPLVFFAPFGSTKLIFHYFEIFKKLLSTLEFKDLDSLLKKKNIKNGIVGEYCFYVGGLYSKRLPENISDEIEVVKAYFKRKPFVVEWLIDYKYYASSSARNRIFQRNTYLIYGKIMNVNISEAGGEKQIVVDIRPYCFGLPKERKDRKPDIAYQKEYEDMLKEEDDD